MIAWLWKNADAAIYFFTGGLTHCIDIQKVGEFLVNWCWQAQSSEFKWENVSNRTIRGQVVLFNEVCKITRIIGAWERSKANVAHIRHRICVQSDVRTFDIVRRAHLEYRVVLLRTLCVIGLRKSPVCQISKLYLKTIRKVCLITNSVIQIPEQGIVAQANRARSRRHSWIPFISHHISDNLKYLLFRAAQHVQSGLELWNTKWGLSDRSIINVAIWIYFWLIAKIIIWKIVIVLSRIDGWLAIGTVACVSHLNSTNWIMELQWEVGESLFLAKVLKPKPSLDCGSHWSWVDLQFQFLVLLIVSIREGLEIRLNMF